MKIRNTITWTLPLTLVGCSLNSSLPSDLFSLRDQTAYKKSGSIVISRPIPDTAGPNEIASNNNTPTRFAPLIGYVPLDASLAPAINETWLKLNKSENILSIYQGKAPIRSFTIEGGSNVTVGVYSLQNKQRNPLWYAPDEYFQSRSLVTPEKESPTRFRQGALGNAALFISSGLAVHSSPVVDPEIGGLVMSEADLLEVYSVLPLGARIEVVE